MIPMSSADGNPELEGSRAPFMQHLQELRWRLWKAIVGIGLAAAISFLFHEQIYDFLTAPLYDSLKKLGVDQIVKARTIQGAFLFHFKTAILGGIFFGIPIVAYQLWQFVAPGLYKNERRIAIPFVVLSSVCFFGGGAFAYFLVLPEAYEFLLGYAVRTGPHAILPDITMEDYLGFTTKLLLAFSIVFELPVAVSFFSFIGLFTHRALLKFWRWSVVLSFVIAALLTPPDYVTQLMLAIPLNGLYGLSIGLAYLITVRRERRAAAADDDDDDDDDTPDDGDETALDVQ